MNFHRIPLSILLITFLTLATNFHQSNSQNSPQNFYLTHKLARNRVGIDKRIAWNATLAAFAKNNTNSRTGDCNVVIPSGGPYGENLAKGTGSFSGTDAVSSWVAERSNYNYSSNTCAPGEICRHYTQVVWANSVQFGCARVLCSNNVSWLVTCIYDPKGNVDGQWPYPLASGEIGI